MKRDPSQPLPGVTARFYQGVSGTWHASVLLDPAVYPDRDALPQRGTRPLVDDGGTGRWWYDLTSPLTESSEDGSRRTHYTPAEARARLDCDVAVLLVEVDAARRRARMLRRVQRAEHREHRDWAHRQDERRVGWGSRAPLRTARGLR